MWQCWWCGKSNQCGRFKRYAALDDSVQVVLSNLKSESKKLSNSGDKLLSILAQYSLSIPLKTSENFGYLTFSGGIEMKRWAKMD